MRRLSEALLVGILAILAAHSQASGAAESAPQESSGAARAMPSMAFASTVAADEIYEALKKFPAFASMDKEKLGSPIAIRVSLEYGRVLSPTNLASALVTIGTLGLLPAVSNRDLLITYDVLVNQSVLASYSYSKKVTRVFNVYSTDRTHGLGADGLEWVTGTASQFAADLAGDSRYAGLLAEYHYYYDAPAATSAR
jgi:hypothetical protein